MDTNIDSVPETFIRVSPEPQESRLIDVTDLDEAELLANLHNNTRALGMGVLHDIGFMTREQAQLILDENPPVKAWTSDTKTRRYDYVMGRPLKTTFVYTADGKTLIDGFALYNRDAGINAGEGVVAMMREHNKS